VFSRGPASAPIDGNLLIQVKGAPGKAKKTEVQVELNSYLDGYVTRRRTQSALVQRPFERKR